MAGWVVGRGSRLRAAHNIVGALILEGRHCAHDGGDAIHELQRRAVSSELRWRKQGQARGSLHRASTLVRKMTLALLNMPSFRLTTMNWE